MTNVFEWSTSAKADATFFIFMIPEEEIPFHPFDIGSPVSRYQSRLPHWHQQGATYFTTFRLADSIPQNVFDEWDAEKVEWLKMRGVRVGAPVHTQAVPDRLRFAFEKEFNRKLNVYLDGCHGKCELREPANRRIVVRRFESVNCVIGGYVIMPNHVHVLVNPVSGQMDLQEAMAYVKGGAARAINEREKRNGKLWQKDNFDHIVRSFQALEKYQRYMEMNARKAGLQKDEYTFHRARYSAV